MEGESRLSRSRRDVLRGLGIGITMIGIGVGVGSARPNASPEIEWDRTYGSSGPDFSVDQVWDVVEVPEGYAFTGRSRAAGGGWLVVVDSADGAVRSMWVYPELLPDALVATDDGGYLLAGRESAEVFSPAVLVKTDADGAKRWSRTYDDLDGTTFDNVGGHSGTLVAVDGSYAFAGSIDGAFGLVRVDEGGCEEWIRTISRESDAPLENDHPTELLATSDGGYLVAGVTGVPSGAFDARLVKLR